MKRRGLLPVCGQEKELFMKNKIKLLFIFLLVFLGQLIYSLELFLSVEYIAITINDTSLTYEEDGRPEATEKYNVTWEIINGLHYINFNYNGTFLDPYQGPKVSHGQKRYLVLYYAEYSYGRNYCNYIKFYDENNKCVWRIRDKLPFNVEIPSVAQATSELKEGNIIYSAKNAVDDNILQPWAVGKTGIGEKIKLRIDTNRLRTDAERLAAYRYWGLVISNGFVDYKRPYLYEYNNRIKKIRVSRGKPGEYVDITLEDTPQLQKFEFRELKTEANILEIEILEVYKGSRYDDTCINLIIPLGVNMTPWNNFQGK